MTFANLKAAILNEVQQKPADCVIARKALQFADVYLPRSSEQPVNSMDLIIDLADTIKEIHSRHCPSASLPSHFFY
jgi:hypothetical protein